MKKEKVFAVIVFALSLILSIVFLIFKDYFQGARTLGLLGLFIINLVSNASLFVSAPALLTVIAGGNMYPPVLVALSSSLGATIGDLIGFIIGFSGRKITLHKLEKKMWFKFLENFFKRHGSWVLFIFAFIPNPLFDSIGVLAGLLNYSLLKFFLIVFIGRLIRYFLLAQAGAWF